MGEANVRFEVSFLFLRVKQPSNTPFLLLKTRETRPKNDGKTIWPNGLPDRVYYDNEYHQQKQKVITTTMMTSPSSLRLFRLGIVASRRH